MKLKLSALKVSNKGKSSSRSQTGTESDSCSSQNQDKPKFDKQLLEDKGKFQRLSKTVNRVKFLETSDSNTNLKQRSSEDLPGVKENVDSKNLGLKTLRSMERRSDRSRTSVAVNPKVENLKNCSYQAEGISKNISRNDAAAKVCAKPNNAKLGASVPCGKTSNIKKAESGTVKRDSEVSKVFPVISQSCKKVSETSKLRSIRRKPGLPQCQGQINNKSVSCQF